MATFRVALYAPNDHRKLALCGHQNDLAHHLALYPLGDGRRLKSPEDAYMHTGNFATMHHALKSAGMDSEHSGCLVTVEERFDARSAKNGQRIIGNGRLFLTEHMKPPLRSIKLKHRDQRSPMSFSNRIMTATHKHSFSSSRCDWVALAYRKRKSTRWNLQSFN